ncbi:MAG: LptE family protein [Flavobacterium sp.]|nr:LptE family protein [Flavobacterium sp.]
MNKIKIILLVFVCLIVNSCGIYNFTGSSKIDAKTFQVNRFQNLAPLVQPGIDRLFTVKLQDLIQSQTNLSITNKEGDLVYEGEIVDYTVSPTTITADIKAAQSRLTIQVNIRFINKKKEADNFERRFSHFYDFPGNELPRGAILNTALDEIYARITQDIFNETLAKW